MPTTEFGQRLKELRESRGLTQGELAELAGMNRFGVAKLEQGVREPHWPTVLALCAALKVDCRAFQVKK
jgi:transcriptional regulator with XRE-family HTH domain